MAPATPILTARSGRPATFPTRRRLRTEASRPISPNNGRCLLCDYLAAERDPAIGNGERVIVETSTSPLSFRGGLSGLLKP